MDSEMIIRLPPGIHERSEEVEEKIVNTSLDDEMFSVEDAGGNDAQTDTCGHRSEIGCLREALTVLAAPSARPVFPGRVEEGFLNTRRTTRLIRGFGHVNHCDTGALSGAL
jgi:hypothetical protein